MKKRSSVFQSGSVTSESVTSESVVQNIYEAETVPFVPTVNRELVTDFENRSDNASQVPLDLTVNRESPVNSNRSSPWIMNYCGINRQQFCESSGSEIIVQSSASQSLESTPLNSPVLNLPAHDPLPAQNLLPHLPACDPLSNALPVQNPPTLDPQMARNSFEHLFHDYVANRPTPDIMFAPNPSLLVHMNPEQFHFLNQCLLLSRGNFFAFIHFNQSHYPW